MYTRILCLYIYIVYVDIHTYTHIWCFLACDPTQQQSGAHTANQPSSWTPQWQQRKLHKTASILAGPTASTKASTQSSTQRCMRGILASNLTRAARRYRMP